MSNKIKFPFAVYISDLEEEAVDKLTEAFKKLGAVEVENTVTNTASMWEYYGVDYAGETQFWDLLDDFGEETISYTYGDFMELVQSVGAEATEEKKETPKEITVVKTYEVYSNGNLMLSGTKEYLEKFVSAIKEALDE